MISIYSDEECISCGRCIHVCPEFVLQFTSDHKVVNNPLRHCVSCGQCVSVCPTGALHHSDYSPRDIQSFNPNDLPTGISLLNLCRKRRSCRNFKKTPVPKELLSQILEAGRYAPTANNSRSFECTVLTTPEKLRLLSTCTVRAYRRVYNLLNHRPVIALMKLLRIDAVKYLPDLKEVLVQYERGTDYIARGATAAIVISADKKDFFARDSANLAYENMSLMAESLGVGQFYMGFVLSGISLDFSDKLRRALGIKHKIYAIMALGMPSVKFQRFPLRHFAAPTRWL